MEENLRELYDEKIHHLQEIEDYLIEMVGVFENAKIILAKIYEVVIIQKKIDEVINNEYEVI